MKRRNTLSRASKLLPEEWYLIRCTEGQLSPEAERALKEADIYYVDLDDFQQKNHTHAVIAMEFNSKYAHTILVHCQQDEMLELTNTPYFQKVWSGPHAGRTCLALSGLGAEQLHLLLRVQDPSPIQVVRQIAPPTEGTWKKSTILEGQMKGIEGQVLCDRSNQRKCWFTLLPLLKLQFLIPAPLLHKPKRKDEVIKPEEPGKCHWFMVYCRTIQHLDFAFGQEEEPLHFLQPDFMPDESSTVCTIFNPEIIERFPGGQEKRRPVFPKRYFIHTTLAHIESYRYLRPDSHVYVMRDKNYRPIRIADKDMIPFIQTLNKVNGIVSTDDQELISLLQPGDLIQYQLHPGTTALLGGIKQIKGHSTQFILLTDTGLVTIHQENIVLDTPTKQQLEKRKS